MEPMDIVGRTKEDASLPKGAIFFMVFLFFLLFCCYICSSGCLMLCLVVKF